MIPASANEWDEISNVVCKKAITTFIASTGSRNLIIVNAAINGLTGESFVSHGKKLNSEVFAEFLGVLLERGFSHFRI